MSKLERNLETISAYLDGELTGHEREQIERLLQEDDNLREWYQELMRTRSVIRNTPALRAPRNYYLTPEMVGQKEQPPRAFPILRFASAFAALLLVLLFLGDYFIIPRTTMAPLMSVQIAESVQLEAEAPEVEAEVLASPPAPALSEPLMQEAPVEGEFAPEAAVEENISRSMDLDPTMGGGFPRQTPAPGEEVEDSFGAATEEMDEAELTSEPEASSKLLEEEVQRNIILRYYLRIAEFSLLVIVILTGLAAIYFFRRTGPP